MKANFNPHPSSISPNPTRVNSSMSQERTLPRAVRDEKKVQKPEKRDTFLSSKGGFSDLMKNLMSQKQDVIDQKNKYLTSAIERGENKDVMNARIETFDSQLQNIDELMSYLTAQEMEKQAEQAKKTSDEQPKTEEEAQDAKISAIISLSTDISQAEKLEGVKAQAENEGKVLKTEIKLDASRGRYNAPDSPKNTRLKEINSIVNNVSRDIAEDITEATDELKEMDDKTPENTQEQ